MSIINQRIHDRRIALGLTLLEVADFLGVKEATAQRYESGAIKSIGHETISALSEILKCSPSYLMGWEDTATSSTPSMPDDIQKLLDTYRKLNSEGKRRLLERADELLDLGYVEKGDAAKMA